MSAIEEQSSVRTPRVDGSAVLFDLYGTLFIFDDEERASTAWIETTHNGLASAGLDASHEVVEAAAKDFFSPEPPYDGDPELTLFERRLYDFGVRLGIEPPADVLRDISGRILESWQGHNRLDPAAYGVLAEVRQRHPVALVTNYDHPPHVWKMLARNRLTEFFDVIVISGELRTQKPEPEIFHHALTELGVGQEDAIHIGDSDDDVNGALAAGITPIRIARGAGGDNGSRRGLLSRLRGWRAGSGAQSPETTVTRLEEIPPLLSTLARPANPVGSG